MKLFKRLIAVIAIISMITGMMAGAVYAADTVSENDENAQEIQVVQETVEEVPEMILADDPEPEPDPEVTDLSDKCGHDLTWSLEGGVLTISGSGSMYEGESYTFPWESDKSSITSVVLGDGVTSIGENAFSGCANLSSVTIPISITAIGASAFSGCSSLSGASYSGTAEDWMSITINDGNDKLAEISISHQGDHVMAVVDGQCQHYCELCKEDETVTDGVYDNCGEAVQTEPGEWVEIDGNKYYYVDSVPVTGWFQIIDDWYYFDETGVMQTGWIKPASRWYYLDENGVMQTGWLNISEKWYYLNPSGSMATGWVQDNGKWYYMKPSGSMATGWVQDNGKWYYMKPSGSMVTGWKQINDKWYYFNSSGKMQTGWNYIDGNWYFMRDSGAMATGWIKPETRWYYMRASGKMATGWLELNGKKYYLESDGHMVVDWHEIKGNWFYFNSNGALQYDRLSMSAKAQLYSSATNYLILIDCNANVMGVFRGSKNNWKMIHEWRCATGAGNTKTPKGVYQIQYQIYSFSGPDDINPLTYSNPLCYTVYWASNFASGGYFIHSTLYRYQSWDVMDDRLGMDLSHGCVRLASDNAKWIWYNIPVGTTVVTY